MQCAAQLKVALDEATGGAHPSLHFTSLVDACEHLQWIVDVPLLGRFGREARQDLWILHDIVGVLEV